MKHEGLILTANTEPTYGTTVLGLRRDGPPSWQIRQTRCAEVGDVAEPEAVEDATQPGARRVSSILLAILGVPLWLVLGGVGAGLWSRRSFRKTPGVFAMKARVIDGAAPPPKWKRQASYARWVHDVLIVHQGLAMVRNRALPVASASPATISSGRGARARRRSGRRPSPPRRR